MFSEQLLQNNLSYSKYVTEKKSYEIVEIVIQYSKPNFPETEHYSVTPIPRHADMCSLQYIIFYSPNFETVDQFKNSIKNGFVELKSGNGTIIRYNFGLLMELNPVKTPVYGSYVIVIPSEYTVNDIAIIKMPRNDVYVDLKIPNAHLIDNVRMFLNYTYLDSIERNNLIDNDYEHVVQIIEHSFDHVPMPNINNAKYLTNNKGLVKGYFIEGDLSEIEKLVLSYDGYYRLEFEKEQLDVHCHKISNNLHYLPFSFKNNYKDMTYDSYIGAHNHANLRVRVDLMLKSSNVETVQSTIKFYVLMLNNLVYKHGHICLQWPSEN